MSISTVLRLPLMLYLPGIAPAHEVQADGLDLAGTQMDLLQKVEELTLYSLQLLDRIDQLETRLDQELVSGN